MAVDYRMGEIADLVSVSVDTVRRWCDRGELDSRRNPSGHRVVDGAELARFLGEHRPEAAASQLSARNRFRGVVLAVERDRVAAKVELQAGPHRLVALLTREAADELGLEPGMVATAVVKATNVMVER